MKPFSTTLRALIGVGAFTIAGWATPTAADNPAWESIDFHAVVSGTSTLHAWKVESHTATGTLRIDAGKAAGSLRIPAKSLSGGPKGLDERMYAALKADTFPTIAFEAVELVAPPALGGADASTWPVRGRLTIAGTTRELTLPCRVSGVDPDRLALETEIEMKMTDFGLKPPTFMGLVRTGDVITVKVRWILAPARGAQPVDPLARR